MPPGSTSGPLRGARILVTRPARQAGGLAQKLAVIDGMPVIFPAIAILPPADPAALAATHAHLAEYDYAVFVSANAVEFGAPDPRRWPAGLTPFAPGPGTAEAVAATGIAGVRIPTDRYDSDGLLALPEFASPAGKRIVVFRGDGGRDQLGDTLRKRGAQVDYVSCYRRARPSNADGLAQLLARNGIDAVTITSSEGLHNLWSLLDTPARARWAALPTFVPHERIADRARELGLVAVLTGSGDAGLIAALLQWAADASGHL